MATLNQIAYNLYNTIRQKGNNDETISIDQIKFQVKITAALLLKQELDKKLDPYSDHTLITDLGCLELETIDADECGLSSGCMVKRTKKPIPKPLNSNQRTLIYRVGPIIKTKAAFYETSMLYASYLFTEDQKFGKNSIYWYLNPSNYHIYLVYDCDNVYAKGLKWLNVMLITLDATEAKCDEDNKCCDADELEYPLSEHLIVALDSIILKQYLSIEALAARDDNNDDDMEYSKDTKQ